MYTHQYLRGGNSLGPIVGFELGARTWHVNRARVAVEIAEGSPVSTGQYRSVVSSLRRVRGIEYSPCCYFCAVAEQMRECSGDHLGSSE